MGKERENPYHKLKRFPTERPTQTDENIKKILMFTDVFLNQTCEHVAKMTTREFLKVLLGGCEREKGRRGGNGGKIKWKLQ